MFVAVLLFRLRADGQGRIVIIFLVIKWLNCGGGGRLVPVFFLPFSPSFYYRTVWVQVICLTPFCVYHFLGHDAFLFQGTVSVMIRVFLTEFAGILTEFVIWIETEILFF